MRNDSEGDSTTYIISGVKDDYIVNQLQGCLRSGIKECSGTPSSVMFLDPFEIHHLIARLSFKFSKEFVSRLRRTLYDQLDMIDRHTQSINTAGEREELKKTHDGIFSTLSERRLLYRRLANGPRRSQRAETCPPRVFQLCSEERAEKWACPRQPTIGLLNSMAKLIVRISTAGCTATKHARHLNDAGVKPRHSTRWLHYDP